MFLHKKYIDEAWDRARALGCPDCESGILECAPGDNVYVCPSCKYSCDDADLVDEWVKAMANEYAYSYISEDDGDNPDDYIEVYY